MAIRRRQIVTALSVLYLTALTILAGYALHSAHTYRLPIPDIICALTLALPPLAGVALETVISLNDRLAAKGHLQTSRVFQTVILVFTIFETVLATLAGAHIAPPGSLDCALKETWGRMFKGKDEEGVRAIQEAFSCCGLNSVRDMAWPFPDREHGSEACMVRFERDAPCIGPWRGEERKVAIMLLVVPIAVFVWKVAILLAPSSGSVWLPSAVRLPYDDGSAAGGSRRRQAIEYRDVEEDASGDDDASVRAEVDRLNNDSNLASRVEGVRSRSTGPWREPNHWREEAD